MASDALNACLERHAELRSKAELAAEAQRRSGLRAGDRLLHRTSDQETAVVWLLACHLAGTVLVPVSGPNRAWADTVGQRVGARAQTTATLGVEPIPDPAPPSTVPAPPAGLRAVVMTSGSTGISKGVWIDDQMIDAGALAAAEVLGLDDQAVFLDLLPAHTVGHLFLAGVPTLAAGGRLAYAQFSPQRFGRVLAEHRPTVTILLPVMFRMLEIVGLDSLRPLRTLGTGASTVPQSMPGSALRMGVERFVHMFGMTEALSPIFARASHDPDDPDATALEGPLGDTEARLGEDGELLLSGSAITRGYDGDPEASAASFVDGFFRTGDLFDFDGRLWRFRGRRDDLVKVNDLRVSPAVTEAVVASVPGVQACAVGAVRRPSGGDALVALVQGSGTSPEAVRAACRAVLDEHHVPRRVLFVDEVPTNAMGKVDRVRAAELFAELEWDTARGPATGDVEQRLATIWAAILDLPSVGVDEDFFVLGGDSLDAVEMLGDVEHEFGRILDPSVLLEAPTVAALADLFRETERTGPAGHGDAPPLFLAYSLAGTGLQYRRLKQLLLPEVPTVTLEAPWWDGVLPGEVSVETLADRHVAELRRIQPRGPYHLAGYSSGCLLAWAIATRLVEAGEEVETMIAVDEVVGDANPAPRFPRHAVPSPPPGAGAIRTVGHYARLARRSPVRATIENAAVLLGQADNLDRVLTRVDLRRAGRVRRSRRAWAIWGLLADASARYRETMPAGDVRVALIRTSENPDKPSDLGWSAVALGGVEIREVPGDHHDLMRDPWVTAGASEIRSAVSGE